MYARTVYRCKIGMKVILFHFCLSTQVTWPSHSPNLKLLSFPTICSGPSTVSKQRSGLSALMVRLLTFALKTELNSLSCLCFYLFQYAANPLYFFGAFTVLLIPTLDLFPIYI